MSPRIRIVTRVRQDILHLPAVVLTDMIQLLRPVLAARHREHAINVKRIRTVTHVRQDILLLLVAVLTAIRRLPKPVLAVRHREHAINVRPIRAPVFLVLHHKAVLMVARLILVRQVAVVRFVSVANRTRIAASPQRAVIMVARARTLAANAPAVSRTRIAV